MSCVEFYKCYDFNDEWYLVEMILDIPSSQIDWGGIVVPEKGVEKSNWQCAYMEQYLSGNGREKICGTYCEPDEDIKPCRVAFFIYKGTGTTLRTPYGDFILDDPAETPERLRRIMEFE